MQFTFRDILKGKRNLYLGTEEGENSNKTGINYLRLTIFSIFCNNISKMARTTYDY